MSGSASFRYIFNYADGTSFTSIAYDAFGVLYVALVDLTLPAHCSYRGTITSIVVEAKSSGGAQAFGRLTFFGYETGSTGLTASKPILGRSFEGNTNSTTFTTIATYTPITAGQSLTLTELELEGKVSGGTGSFRYRLNYADGTSFPSIVYTTTSPAYATLVNPKISIQCSYSGTITSIALEAATDSGSNTATGRLTVSGFEAAP